MPTGSRPGSPSGPVAVSFSITKGEYAEGMRHLLVRQPSTWVAPVAGACATVVGVLTGAGAAIGAGILVVFLAGVSFRASPAARWRRTPVLGADQAYLFGDDGVDVRVGTARQRFGWDSYTGVGETRSLFVLLRNSRQGNFIPKRAFGGPEAQARFRELVAAHLVGRS